MTGEVLAVLALLLFAANAFLVRPAGRLVPQDLGFLVVLAANVVFGAVLLLLQAASSGWPERIDVPALGAFAVAGVFAGYLGRLGYFRSVELVGPSRASAVQNSSPLFALVLAWVLLGQALTPLQLLFMVAVVVGLVVAGTRRTGTATSTAAGRDVVTRAMVFGLLSAAAYGAGNVLRGFAIDRWQEPLVGALAGAVIATTAYVAIHPAARVAVRRLGSASRKGLGLWALSGSLMICGQASVIAATATLPVAVVVAVSAATPVVVVPVSIAMGGRHEGLTVRVGLGAALIASGVAALLLL